MRPIMQLHDVVRQLVSVDQDATIYAAQPWTSESNAIVAKEPESGELPEAATREGLDYFLEVFIARDFLEGWESQLDRTPSDQERCDRLIEYAINDA